MIRLEGVTLKFDEQTVISNLNHTFESGKLYGIIGPSGIGKTTLLNAIAGLITPAHGKIVRNAHKIAYVFQESRLFPWMTALENVECVCHDKEKSEHYLGLLLHEGKEKYPHELSGGMKQRVSIARALAYDADIVLLDEPFKGLDIEAKQNTVNTVMKFIKDKTSILISHDSDDLRLCDHIYQLDGIPVSSLVEVKSASALGE